MAEAPRYLIHALKEAGIDLAELSRRAGIDGPLLDVDAEPAQLDRFMIAVHNLLHDPSYGLLAGARCRPEHFGLVQFAAMTGPNVRTALERHARYAHIEWGDYRDLVHGPDYTALRITPVRAERVYARAKLDMQLAAVCTFMRHLTVVPVVPAWVSLQGPPPAYAATYAEVLRCRPRFNALENAVAFGTADLAVSLGSANAKLDAVFEALAEDELMRHDVALFADKVRVAIARLIQRRIPTLDQVARDLCMSTRTLQRKLLEENASFSELLDETRRSLALRQLRSSSLSCVEIASMLKFADPNSFFRAFRRWTGMTPEGFRAAARSTAAVDSADPRFPAAA